MAPYFETEFDPRKRTQRIIRELKKGDSVILVNTRDNQVKVFIEGPDEALVSFSQNELAVSTGDLEENGVTISFTENILPQSGFQRVKQKSICTDGRNASNRRVIWREPGK